VNSAYIQSFCLRQEGYVFIGVGVRLFVCKQDYAKKTTQPIFIKFGGKVVHMDHGRKHYILVVIDNRGDVTLGLRTYG